LCRLLPRRCVSHAQLVKARKQMGIVYDVLLPPWGVIAALQRQIDCKFIVETSVCATHGSALVRIRSFAASTGM
jgi:hypothetical protein